MKFSVKILLCLVFYYLISGCSNKIVNDVVDEASGFNKEEIEDFFVKDKDKKKRQNNSFIPPLPQRYKSLAIPKAPDIANGKLISFSVTDNVPLKDVLIELGRIIDVDVDIDPNIQGGIIMNAKNRPIKEVLDRLSSLANIRYSYKNDVLSFKRDLPYNKNYNVNYLDNKLWGEVENNVTQIVKDIEESNSKEGSIASNTSIGILTVYANSKQHKRVKKYLDDVERKATAQVLIEAKVIEVTLNDEYHTGINWGVGDQDRGGAIQSNTGFAASDPISFILNAGNSIASDLSLSISALDKFGVAKAISSPRLNALNRQEAVLKFVDTLVYFHLTTNQDTVASANTSVVQVSFNAEKKEEDVGVELRMTPDIDIDKQEISLAVIQKLSVSTETVEDPTIIPGTGTSEDNPAVRLGNQIPVIETREIDTTMRLKSGDVLVIGGLMRESSDNDDSKVPFLHKIPVVNVLFKEKKRNKEIVETVIFIKATIVNSGDVNKYDRDIHNNFTSNPKSFFE